MSRAMPRSKSSSKSGRSGIAGTAARCLITALALFVLGWAPIHPAQAQGGATADLFLLGLVPEWELLPDGGTPDFLLPVPGDAFQLQFVVAAGEELIWVQPALQETVVLPATGLAPPFRLLMADVLPGGGDELVVAGGDRMVAGRLPPSGWTPLPPVAPGVIDGLVSLPADDGTSMLVAAVDGGLWIAGPGGSAWQPAELDAPGQPTPITALTAPVRPFALVTAWDGEDLHHLEIEFPDGQPEARLSWRRSPVRTPFPVTSLSVLAGMIDDTELFATGPQGLHLLDLVAEAQGPGWSGPVAVPGDAVAATAQLRDGRPWLIVARADGTFERRPLDDPEAELEPWAIQQLGEVRGLTVAEDRLIALDCCSLRHLVGEQWLTLYPDQQPTFVPRVLGTWNGRTVIAEGRRIDAWTGSQWQRVSPEPAFEVLGLAGAPVSGGEREDLLALSSTGLWLLAPEDEEPTWQRLEGFRMTPRLLASGEALVEGGRGLILMPETGSEEDPDSGPAIRFERIEPAGLADYRYPGEGHSPGAVLADLDDDGDPDFYLPASDGANQLWRNDGGDLRQVPGAAGAGDPRHSTGAVAGDYDGDGDLDLYVTNFLEQPIHPSLAQRSIADAGRNTLYRNLLTETGELAFEDVTDGTVPPAGEGPPGQRQLGVGFAVDAASGDELLARTLTASWGDTDRDGDLDLFVGNHTGNYDGLPGQRDVLYRNQGDGTFVDLTLAAGVPGGELVPGIQQYGATQAAVFADVDDDGWVDLLVTDKMGVPVAGEEPPDHLYRNSADGGFEDWRDPHDPDFGLVTAGAMGIALGDVDHDGDLDYYLTDGSRAERLRREVGENDFHFNRLAEDGELAWERRGEAPAAFSWGAALLDADLDGDQDLWVTTSAGWLDFLYRNELMESGEARFTDVAAAAGVGLASEDRAVLPGDLDGDGRIDAVVVTRDDGVAVFRNVTPRAGRHWLAVRIAGEPVGTWVEVTADLDGDGIVEPRERQLRALVAGGNTCASTAGLTAHFGLGRAAEATVRVRRPDGTWVDFGQVAGDRTVTLQAERLQARRLTGP